MVPVQGHGTYALKITDLDPLEFDLLFERFLNRNVSPCLLTLTSVEKRPVIEHVADAYGRCGIAIITSTMAAKAVIRDGRVLGIRTDLSIVSRTDPARSGDDAGSV